MTAGKIARGDQELRDIGNWIHSLGLGRTEDVEKRRCCLSKLLADGSLSNMQRGLILHALTDAYSHTFETHDVYTRHKRQRQGPTYTTGYPEYLGHAGHGTWPDIIANWPSRYVSLMERVQQAVSPGADPAALATLSSRILNPKDPIHESQGGLYPNARALAQQISGDPLDYRPELIQEHPMNSPVSASLHGEPYPLPTANDIRNAI